MRNPWLVCAGTMLLALGVFGLPGTGQASGDDTKAVKEAVDRFYSALNMMFGGDLTPMKNVWSHADNVTYMGPGGGFQIGWAQVRAEWELQAAKKLGGEVKPRDLRFTIGRDLAIVSNYEIGENLGLDQKVRKVSIRATNLFRKENGKWKMIGHHTDLLPFLQP